VKKTEARRSSKVPHSKRPEVRGVCHVVLRIQRGLPWLRTPRTYRVLEGAIRDRNTKLGFAVVHYSVQGDHLHLLVEAEGKRELARGLQGLLISIAKRLNRWWRRRRGSVFADRYFCRLAAGAREVKRALHYVLNNARKHGSWSSPDQPDPFSSARWFWGLVKRGRDICRPLRTSPVAEARSMDLQIPGFLNLDVAFVPGRRHYPEQTGDTLAALLAL